MVTLNAHYDGKTIVLDEDLSLPLRPGTRLKVSVEAVEEPDLPALARQKFEPLNIRIDPELSKAIALDREFNIEES